MSFAISITGEPGVQSNLVDTTTERQRRILNAAPSLYMTPETAFMDISGGKLRSWHDACGQGRFDPDSVQPNVIDEGAGLSSIEFTGVAGQALIDLANIDRLPLSGTPGAIVYLIRHAPGPGNFGGAILGNKAASGLGSGVTSILYTDGTAGTPSLQTKYGTPNKDLYSTVSAVDSTFHTVIMTWLGSGPGARVIQDGAGQIVASNTLDFADVPNVRKILIGDCSQPGVFPLKGRLAGLAIFPKYLVDPANATLLADINAEFGAYRASLNS